MQYLLSVVLHPRLYKTLMKTQQELATTTH